MQLFLDTTDTAVLKDLAATGLVDGVTTNPTLIAKSGRNMLEVIGEICAIVGGPVSAEVASMETAGMLAEGRQYLATAWWAGTFPGLLLMVTIVAINLIGDSLRDILDPRIQ